ncbi:MAG: exonuclease SbcCD subunit D [Bacteroidota bacterium]|nr:exonuclease SbcCD subunit D [Bacteroidota bacterium]
MKILHCADIHFGVGTYGRIDPKTGLNTRLLDFKRSFQFLVSEGIRENIDAFLFCGDAFHTSNPTPTQQREFTECLLPLADHGIPIIMITGNHDHPVAHGKASSIDIFRHLKGVTHVFRRADRAVIETKSGPLQLIAMPWPVRSLLLYGRQWQEKSAADLPAYIEQLYTSRIASYAKELDPSLPTVLAGHFTVQGAVLGQSESTRMIQHEPKFTTSALTVEPIDYVALGHIHHHQNLAPTTDSVPVVYSSSIERVSFKEQGNPKGFVLVTITGAPKRTSYRFVETPARRFISVKVDLSRSQHPTRTLLRRISTANIKDAIVRVRYRITEAQRSELDTGQIRAALQSAHAIAAIERTTNPIEREQRSDVTGESTLEEALDGYVQQHEHLVPLRKKLQAAARGIEREVFNPVSAA